MSYTDQKNAAIYEKATQVLAEAEIHTTPSSLDCIFFVGTVGALDLTRLQWKGNEFGLSSALLCAATADAGIANAIKNSVLGMFVDTPHYDQLANLLTPSLAANEKCDCAVCKRRRAIADAPKIDPSKN